MIRVCACMCNDFLSAGAVVCHGVRSTDDESVIGPLTADNDVSSTQPQQLSDDNGSKPLQPDLPSGPFVYRFQLWARLA